jgi:hypothetical protein
MRGWSFVMMEVQLAARPTVPRSEDLSVPLAARKRRWWQREG